MKNSKFSFMQRGWAVLLAFVLICTMLSNTLIPVLANTLSANATRIETLLATLDLNNVTVADAAAINEIDVLYEGLDATEKARYETNVSALKTALSKLNKQGYTAIAESGFTGYHYKNTFTHSTVDGAVRLVYGVSNMNPARTAWMNTMVELDGFEILINRFVKSASSAQSGFGFVLSAGSNADGIDITQASKSGLLVYIDMMTGNLNVARKDGSTVTRATLLTGNDGLKLANLQYEAFTVAFNATNNSANPYKITVTTADGDVISANIPAEYFNADTVLSSGKTYVALTPGRYNPTGASGFESLAINDTFDIIGYRDNSAATADIAWLNEKLATLDVSAVQESDAAVINKVVTVYNSLTAIDKTKVTNGSKVSALKDALLPIVKDGYITYGAASEFTSDHWSTSTPPVLSYVDGMIGLCFNDTALSVGKRIGPDNSVEFDGIEYKFNNLVNHSDAATVAGFGIAFTKDTSFVTSGTFSSGLLLYLDAKAGNLLLNLNGKTKYLTLIENSDVLKLANLEYNAFTLGIVGTDDAQNPYRVTVRSANGQSVSANIPAEYFDAATVMSGGKSYVTFTRGRYDSTGATTGTTYTTFNVVGYRNSKESQANIAWVNAQLVSLDAATITEANAAVINKMNVLVENMIPAEKLQITDMAKYTALQSALLTLVKDGYVAFTESNLNGYHYNNTFTHSTVNGAVRINYNVANMNPARTVWTKTKVDLNGFVLKINRFVKASDSAQSGFGMVLSAGSNADGIDITNAAKSGLLVYIDMMTGNLNVARKDGSTVTRATLLTGNDGLKLANLQYEAFTVAFNATNDSATPYKITLTTADGDVISANIPAEYFNADTVLSSGKTYVALTPGRYNPTGASGFENLAINDTFDIIGHANNAETQENIYWINAQLAALDVATVTEAQAATVNKLSALYNTLTAIEKSQITNADKIALLETAVMARVQDGYTAITEADLTGYHYKNTFTHSVVNGAVRVNYNVTNLNPTRTVWMNKMTELDGFELKISRFVKDKNSVQSGFGMVLSAGSNADGIEITTNANSGLLLYIDMMTGDLNLVRKDGATVTRTTLVTGDAALKLANLQYEVFTISFNATDDAQNPYTVTIKTSDGDTVSANIPAEYFNAEKVLSNGNTYVALSSGRYNPAGGNTFEALSVNDTFDIVGYRDNTGSAENIAWVNEQLSSLDAATVTEADAATINKLNVVYANMIPSEKAQITGADEIAQLLSVVNALIKDGYVNFSGYTQDHWDETGWFTNTADYAHFNLATETLNPAMRIGGTAAVKLDGLKLKFNNLQKNGNGTSTGFGILLANSAGKEFKSNSAGLLLYIEAETGSLLLNLNGTSKYAELVSNSDALKLSSLEYNSFTVHFCATYNDAAPYSVTIKTADGKSVTAQIPAEYFDATSIFSGKNTFVTFTRGRFDSTGSYSGSVYCSFDFMGYKGEQNADNLVAWIAAQLDTLDAETVAESDSALINKIDVMYELLPDGEKAQFTSKINALKTALLAITKDGYTAITEENFTGYHYKNTFTHSMVDGVHRLNYNVANMNPARTAWLNRKVVFDGFELKITRFSKGEAGAKTGFGMVFSAGSNADGIDITQPANSGMIVYIDMNDGALYVQRKDGTSVVTNKLVDNNNLLKLANLAYETFTISFNSTNDSQNPYKITLKTADGDEVTANIPAAYFNADTVLAGDETYVAFTPGRYNPAGGNTFENAAIDDTFDILGYRNNTGAEESVLWVNEKLASLDPAMVTQADAATVNKVVALYAKMIPSEKARIVGAQKIAALESKVFALIKDGYQNFSEYTQNHWAESGWFTNTADYAHFNLSTATLNPAMRIGGKAPVKLDGLELKFANLRKTGNGTANGFGILLSSTAGKEFTASAEGILLYIDVNTGSLILNYNGKSGYTELVSASDVLKLSSLEYNAFVVRIDATDDAKKPYKVTITTADGRSVSAFIDVKYLKNTFILDNQKTYITFTRGRYDGDGGYAGSVYCSFDFLGYKAGVDFDAKKVIALIDALPSSLTADCGEQLDKIYTEYLSASEEQLAEISNLDKFLKLMKAYRKDLAFETDVFGSEFVYVKPETIPKWWPTGFNCYSIENDGGVRLVWNGKGRDVRQGYSKRVPLHGLKLQFNAMHKSSIDVSDPKFAIYLGDGLGSPWTYNATVTTRPLAIVLDTEAGALYAYPGKEGTGALIVKDERLKYESLEYKTFYVEFNQNDKKLWQVEIITDDWTVCGTIADDDFTSGERFKDFEGCYVTVSAWEKTYATLEWTGIGQSTKHIPVTEMINELRVVDIDSEPAIEAAEKAYDALPEYVQSRVSNLYVLEEARETFYTLDKTDPVPYVIEQIKRVEKIDITMKDTIDDVEEWYNSLTKAQKARVTNADVLENAIKEYHKLYAQYMDWDSCVYAPGVNDAKYDQETIDSWWHGTVVLSEGISGGTQFTFTNAKRDHRNAFGTYDLDGLNIQLSNLVKTGKGVGTGVLAITVGPNYTDYGKGQSVDKREGNQFVPTAKRALVVVLDTNEGTITIYPAGNKYFTRPVEIFSDDALKYENITGKNFSLMFDSMGSDTYSLRFMISDGTLLSGEIPSSVICPLTYFGSLNKCYVQVGAWQNDTYQSVELVSIYDYESQNAVSQVMPVMEYIDKLPEKATLEGEDDIRLGIAKYRSLKKKGLKAQVSNYGKLSSLIEQLSTLWDNNNVDPYEYEIPADREEEFEELLKYGSAKDSPVKVVPLVTESGESSGSVGSAIATCFAALLAGLLLATRKGKVLKTGEEDN